MNAKEILADLEERRKNIGLRSLDVAKAAGISLRLYSYWRTGDRCPTFDGLVAIKEYVENAEAKLMKRAS